jgi:hypothetical protein
MTVPLPGLSLANNLFTCVLCAEHMTRIIFTESTDSISETHVLENEEKSEKIRRWTK